VLWLRGGLNIFEPNSSAIYGSDESNRSADHISDVAISNRQSDETNRDPNQFSYGSSNTFSNETNLDPNPFSNQSNRASHCCTNNEQPSGWLRYVVRTDLDHHGQLGHADNLL
jgi:hypothetical protein